MEKLYPTDEAKQMTPLDSEASAKARMLSAMEVEINEPVVIAAGLNGSDEFAKAKAIYDNLVAERSALKAIDRTAQDYADQVAAAVVNLDKDKWLAAQPAKVATIEDLKIAEK